jgi:hypothetical protein
MMSADKSGSYWFDFIDEWIDYDEKQTATVFHAMKCRNEYLNQIGM